MNLILAAILSFVIFGFLSYLSSDRQGIFFNIIRAAGPIVGSIMGLIPVIQILIGDLNLMSIDFPWTSFSGNIYLELDALSAFFLIPIFILTILTSIYGLSDMGRYYAKRNLGSLLLFFNLLIASLVLVLCARNAILFLVAWELMSLTSFFLVMFESEKELSIRSSWLYLSVTHLGSACLIIFFFLMADGSSSFYFNDFPAIIYSNKSTICFLLALVGFGTKAGMIPFHIWLPAEVAAPSHVSAFMSGAVMKMGIYGILRAILLIGAPQWWWGVLLISMGSITGIIGIIFALVQHDIKSLLAYSGVENIGIILIAIGLGVTGIYIQSPLLCVLGFTGGILHVLNHSLFKCILFLCAGSIISVTHTQQIDKLGGLLKKMPLAAFIFLSGSIAICGIPPFNGFISEFFIYFASFKEISLGNFANAILPTFAIISLTMIGGLSVLCFTKAFSIMFLGEPRQTFDHDIKESPMLMIMPMALLAGFCLIIGIFPRIILPLLDKPVAMFNNSTSVQKVLLPINNIFNSLTITFLILISIIITVTAIRKLVMRKRSYSTTVTWDCAYHRPQSTMQYTASSFVDSLSNIFYFLLKTKKQFLPPTEFFPLENSELQTHTDDMFAKHLYHLLHIIIKRTMYRFIKLQHGSTHIYLFYIVAFLIALLTINSITEIRM